MPSSSAPVAPSGVTLMLRLGGLLLGASAAAAQLNVPDAPTIVELDVLSGSDIRVSFEAPLTDGGAAVQAYSVEWDTDPGVQEIQTITTSTYTGANEVQTLTTTALDQDEIQLVTTNASALYEVQTVETDCASGGTLGGTFVLGLDTTRSGGSAEISGEISFSADPEGDYLSVKRILEEMKNVGTGGVVAVERSATDAAKGSYVWTVTFATHLGNLPQLTLADSSLTGTGATVLTATVRDQNLLSGYFRLEYGGYTTASLPHDATGGEVASALEALSTIDSVDVFRAGPTDQGGYNWTVTFTSDYNGANVPEMVALYHDLGGAGASAQVTTLRDGNELSGGFNVSFSEPIGFGFPDSATVPFAATPSELKAALESVGTGDVSVHRSGPDFELGYTWTISFLEYEGDLPHVGVAYGDNLAGTVSDLTGVLQGLDAQARVVETRKGTIKEVQTISTYGGTNQGVNASTKFFLKFRGETTGVIEANVNGTCDATAREVQTITTSTVDTFGAGGDAHVSSLLYFSLVFYRQDGAAEETAAVFANPQGGDCSVGASALETVLHQLDALEEVSVSYSSPVDDESCTWKVTFNDQSGNLDQMAVKVQGGANVGASASGFWGDDTVSIATERDGTVDAIKYELEKLSTVGTVTVTPANATSNGGCTWRVTFDTNTGTAEDQGALSSLSVAALQPNGTYGNFENTVRAWPDSTDIISICNDTAQCVTGTSVQLGGQWAAQFRGHRTLYVDHDVTARGLKEALEATPTMGRVDVTRAGPDENLGYTWSVTFLTELGDLPPLLIDTAALTGTAPYGRVVEHDAGVFPPFDSLDPANGLPLGSTTLTELDDLALTVGTLEQGIPYYFRVSAINANGQGPAALSSPAFAVPLPQAVMAPSEVSLTVVDGGALAVAITAPLRDGGEEIDRYRVQYAQRAFAQEVQTVRVSCAASPEIQVVATDAQDIDEVQLVHAVLEDGFEGLEQYEVQNVRCDATSGTFTLSIFGETTADINVGDSDADIQARLQELTRLNNVNVSFPAGSSSHSACADCADANCEGFHGFNVTFYDVEGASGNMPPLTADVKGLSGNRRVGVSEVVRGSAGLSGSFRLTFRGFTTVDLSYNASASEMQTALQQLDPIPFADGVQVSRVPGLPYEAMWAVTFTSPEVGGNVESLNCFDYDDRLEGNGARIVIHTDGSEGPYARRYTNSSVSGNEIGGTFTLSLLGHTTDAIDFNAADTQMKARLEALPNVGTVQVSRSTPTPEKGYQWTVTFVSNPGAFPVGAADVEPLTFDLSQLSGLNRTSNVTEQRAGYPPLGGTFQLRYTNGSAYRTTLNLAHNSDANEVGAALEALDDMVGRVSVQRTTNADGYTWSVTFGPCATDPVTGQDVCNEGDLYPLELVSNASLLGCETVSVAVAEVVTGSGPALCPERDSGYCFDDVTDLSGGAPYTYEIAQLDVGVPYYIRVAAHTDESFGTYAASNPEFAVPSHLQPGPPPRVRLLSSTETTVSLEWDPPTEHGGAPVTGYELWMDNWEGGNLVKVYDGTANSHVTVFTVDSANAPHLESGRKYQFTVRALNLCRATDLDLACYGDFSDPAVFTVRAPRPPLAPPQLTRDSFGTAIGHRSVWGDGSITVNWLRSIDNGGSPITSYRLFMESPDGNVTQVVVNPAESALAIDQNGTRAYAPVGEQRTYRYTFRNLDEGEVYVFQVAAVNVKGRSGLSAPVAIVCATRPGGALSSDITSVNQTATYGLVRPTVTDVSATSIALKWDEPNDRGLSPITGYEVWMYPGAALNTQADPDPVKQEIQVIRTVVATPAAEVQVLTLTNARDGGQFRVRVRAESRVGGFVDNTTALLTLGRCDGRCMGQALENASPVLGNVTVTGPVVTNSSHAYTITFKEYQGPLRSVAVVNHNLEDRAADATWYTSLVRKIKGTEPLRGSFTVAFRGEETPALPYDVSAKDLANELNNLDSIDTVTVTRTESYNDGYGGGVGEDEENMNHFGAYAWTVTFVNTIGDLPLLYPSPGRLTCSSDERAAGETQACAGVSTTTPQPGSDAVLVYDGRFAPAVRSFTAEGLTTDALYSFKVVPINAVGRGLPSAATATVSARVGASPSQTTVRGGAVSVGMAGVVHETQVVTAYDTDGYFALTLGSWYGESLPIWANVATAGWDVSSTRNLLLEPNNDRVVASATAMEHALTAPGTGIEQVHVTRGAAAERDGHSGVSWTITFLSPLGNVPTLRVNSTNVTNGFVTVNELLSGASNEFTIEPKKASGAPVKDVTSGSNFGAADPIDFSGGDVFFTELWSSGTDVLDGTHTWTSDGGVASYSPVLYEIQRLYLPSNSTGGFRLKFDQTSDFPGKVDQVCGYVSGDFGAGMRGKVDFLDSVEAQEGLAPSAYDGQTWLGGGNEGSFGYECFGGTRAGGGGQGAPRLGGESHTTANITVNASALDVKNALEALPNIEAVDVSYAIDSEDGSMTYLVTFTHDLGDLPLLQYESPMGSSSSSGVALSSYLNVSEVQEGHTEVQTVTTDADIGFIREVQTLTSGVPCCNGQAQGFFNVTLPGADSWVRIAYNAPAEARHSGGNGTSVQEKLQSLSNVGRVGVTRQVMKAYSNDTSSSHFQWSVTFYDPVGDVPDLMVATAGGLTNSAPGKTSSAYVDVNEVTKGISPLGGTFTLSFGDDYTDDLDFDASNETMKAALEALPSIDQVNVRREDLGTGHRWEITFTKALGNLPELVAHMHRSEIQHVRTLGGDPTPLGGSFSLSYGGAATQALAHDASAASVKAALEALPTLDYVDVARDIYNFGQYRWRVTFRSEVGDVPMLVADTRLLTGSDARATVIEHVAGDGASLTGSTPFVRVAEKEAGLPAYTALYQPNATGPYTLAVRQLTRGGLDASYFDNQWLLGEPATTKVDASLQFDWGTGAITRYGRDYVSARWVGKIVAPTTELYTLYLFADDGARLWLDHEMLIDAWDGRVAGRDSKAFVNLTRGQFHNLRVEYKEETGRAGIALEWASMTQFRAPVPSSAFYYATHVSGSPYALTVLPGASDYPFTSAEGPGLSAAVAGEPAYFTIQARDENGNARASDEAAEDGDFLNISLYRHNRALGQSDFATSAGLSGEHPNGDLTGFYGAIDTAPSTLGKPEYLGGGKYRVSYTVLKSGFWKLHVQTGGTDIECGRGSAAACSPFTLFVDPGPTVAATTEAEGALSPIMDALVEASAGDMHYFSVQAKDAYGNNRITGGDPLRVSLNYLQGGDANTDTNANIAYRGHVIDHTNGTYLVTYTVPRAGTFAVDLTLDSQRISSCTPPVPRPAFRTRQYDGLRVYRPPHTCGSELPPTLTVVHGPLQASMTTAVESTSEGLNKAVVGVANSFTIESRDEFGNLRRGDGTNHFLGYGDGRRDPYTIDFAGPQGYTYRTSSAVMTIACNDSSAEGLFRLSWDGAKTLDLPLKSSASAIEAAVRTMHPDDPHFVRVSRYDTGASVSESLSSPASNHTFAWSVTFLSHLDKWAEAPLTVEPPSFSNRTDAQVTSANDPDLSAYSSLQATIDASGGLYPVHYTLWYTGSYFMTVKHFNGEEIEGSPFTIEVDDGATEASTSFATGQGLLGGVTGEQLVFTVTARDVRQIERQAVFTNATVVPVVPEKQKVVVSASVSTSVVLSFRGESTSTLAVGATWEDVETALEELATIDDVQILNPSTTALAASSDFELLFVGTQVRGDVPLLGGSGVASASESRKGDAPFVREVQTLTCTVASATTSNAQLGTFELRAPPSGAAGGFRGLRDNLEKALVVNASLTLGELSAFLTEELGAGEVAVTSSNAASTLDTDMCTTTGDNLFLTFEEARGDVPNLRVNSTSTTVGLSMEVGGHGGSVDGVHPLWGDFTLEFKGETTRPLPFDATAEEVEGALERLPTVGGVSVELVRAGRAIDSRGADFYPDAPAGLFDYWLVTFDGACENGTALSASSSSAYPDWSGCPAHIGDEPLLVANGTGLKYARSAHVLQAAPVVSVVETTPGSAGNNRDYVNEGQYEQDESADFTNLRVQLVHQNLEATPAGGEYMARNSKSQLRVGIGNHEVQALECVSSDLAGTFGLYFLGDVLTVRANASLEEFKAQLHAKVHALGRAAGHYSYPPRGDVSLSDYAANVSSAAVKVSFADNGNSSSSSTNTVQTTVCAHRDPTPVLMEFVGLSATHVNPGVVGTDASLNYGTLPEVNVTFTDSAVVHTYEVVKGLDFVKYMGRGEYQVGYTPTVKGHYDMTITLSDRELGTDLSNGVFVAPSEARAAQIEHSCNSVAVEGVAHSFTVQARDAYDNALDGPSRGGLTVTLEGSSTARASGFATAGEAGYGYLGSVVASSSSSSLTDLSSWGLTGFASLVEQPLLSSSTPNTDGISRLDWVPRVAGSYTFSANYTDRGGLLATYFRNADFTSAILSNTAPQTYPYHSPPHCPVTQLAPKQREDGPSVGFCDSTRLDTSLNFDWGEGPPGAFEILDHVSGGRGHTDGRDGFMAHPAGANFPTDYWGAQWEGFVAPSALSASAAAPGGIISFLLDTDEDATASVYIGGELVVSRTPNDEGLMGASEGNWTVPVDRAGLLGVPGARTVNGVVVVPLMVTYSDGRLDAKMNLQWRSPNSGVGVVTLPSSALYYTRHIEDSPYTFLVYPGEIDARATSASGDGLTGCTTMETCFFTIQARDSNANQRFNRGDDDFLLTLTGVEDWAAEGRVNDAVYLYTDDKQYRNEERRVRGVRTVAHAYYPDFAPLDWVNLGSCEAVLGLKYLNITNAPNVTALVSRGATIAVGNETFIVDQHPGALFDATVLPLADPFRQPSGAYDLWLGGDETGTYRVQYHPNVRGKYRLDVQLPAVPEVQVVETFVDPGATLGGNFSLVFRALDKHSGLPRQLETGPIAYNATASELQAALAQLENVDIVNVTQEVCQNPGKKCKWAITFNRVRFDPAPVALGGLALTPAQVADGDVFFPNLVPDVRELKGNNASIAVTEVTKGRPPQHIHGSPFFVHVASNVTHAPTTTAFGRGLYAGTTGEVSSFTVQAKDDYGNDRTDDQEIDHWLVVPFLADFNYDEFEGQSPPSFEVAYEGNGQYGVDFTPVLSGDYTIAVLHAELREKQRVTTRFPSASPIRREGTWSLILHQVGGGVMSGSGLADSLHRSETARVETLQLAWDASADAVRQAILALGVVGSEVTVVRSDLTHSEDYQYDYPSRHEEYESFGATSHFGFTYDIAFPDYVGDLPLLEPNFANTLVGGWINATSVVDGTCAHIKTEAAPLVLETQVVRINGDSPFGGTFHLAFRGHATAPLAWNAEPESVQTALEALLPIGSVVVTRNATRATTSTSQGFEYAITFMPHAKCNRRHALNYGNLPDLAVYVDFDHENATAAVYSGGNPSPDGVATHDGASPFSHSAKVISSAVSPEHTTAVDSPGVYGKQGLRSGTYNATSSFVVESRDRFGNRVLEGPLAEVQVVTTACAPPCNLNGYFTLSYRGHSVELEAGVGIAEMESSLEALSTVGALTVTTYGVHDPIGSGARVSAIFTDPDLIPQGDLSAHLAVGDWVRVGSADGFVYSIVGMKSTPPYTLRLNKPYEGMTDVNASLWRQDKKANVHGYQYIVTFDSNTMGDLPALVVNGSRLVAGAGGNQTSAEVTACDWMRRQTIATSAASPINGTFYLVYGGERTRDMPYNVNASEVQAELNALDTIFACSVEPAVVAGAYGARAWTVHLLSVVEEDEALEPIYAEGHLLQGTFVQITVENDCPSNGRGKFPDQCNTTATGSEGEAGSSFHVHGCSIQTVAGRLGSEYLVELLGASKVMGKATHLGVGLYRGEFETPRVGNYELTVAEAHCCGLATELFNNRWLLGEPVATRIDPSVDFQWSVADTVSPSGRDYVSVRWVGYLQPSFSETFEFVLEINDGARLFLDDELLLDAFEAQVDDPATDHDEQAPVPYSTYHVTTTMPLAADRLYSLRLEFRESTGGAVARLMWKSDSQPLEVVPNHRLFHATTPLPLSPWEVRPIPIEPLAVVDVSLAIVAWDQLEVTWFAPWDDGGSDVEGYKVEWWAPSQYGTKDVQTFKFASNVDSGTWHLRSPTGEVHHSSLDWNVTSAELESALENFADIGDVTVTYFESPVLQTRSYRVVFETNLGNVSSLGVDAGNLYATDGSGIHTLTVCAHGVINVFCNSTDSVAGNATLRGMSTNVVRDETTANRFSYVIQNLDQKSSNTEGFDVRVSALNAAGYGLASPPVNLKPMQVPDPPGSADARLVPGEDDHLRVHWTEVSTDPSKAMGLKYGDRASPVDAYLVEWDPSPNFDSNLALSGGRATAQQPNPHLSSALGSSLRAPGFYTSPRVANATDAEWFAYDVTGLTPGVPYFTRVSARNEMGLGNPRLCDGDKGVNASLAPRTAPVPLEYGPGVSLSTVPATKGPGVTVKESTQSLLVQFKAPLDNRGADVLDYLVEWWRADDDEGRQEVQVVQCAILASGSGSSKGLRGTFVLSYAGYATDTLAWDTTEETLELALENLPPLRDVQVTRAPAVTGNASKGYEWAVTFLTEEPFVDNHQLTVDGSGLGNRGGSGSSAGVSAAVGVALAPNTPGWHGSNMFDVVQGSTALTVSGGGAEKRLKVGDWVRIADTHYHLVIAKNDANTTFTLETPYAGATASNVGGCDFGVTVPGRRLRAQNSAVVPAFDAARVGKASYTITGLPVNVAHSVRVSARNARGLSVPQISTPSAAAPPPQKPDRPTSVILLGDSDRSLRVLYNAPDDDGGATVTKYKVEWDPSALFNSGPGGSVLGSHHQVLATPVGACALTPCEYTISGLTKGTFYYVRVFAYNKFGFSVEPSLTEPPQERPCTFAPPPATVTVAPVSSSGSSLALASASSSSSLMVSFTPSPDDGGCPVTKYKVEWDAAGAVGFAAGAAPTSSLLYGAREVQVITVLSRKNDLQGTFRVGLDGGDFATEPLVAGCSAATLQSELRALPSMGGVRVSRRELSTPDGTVASDQASHINGYGYAYTVTFVGHGGGRRWVGDVASLRVSTNASDYPSEFTAEASEGTLLGTRPSIAVATAVDGSRGFEQQQLRLFASSGSLRGTWRLGWQAKASPALAWNSSAAQVADALRSCGSGPVRVARTLDNNAMGAPKELVATQERKQVSDALGAWDGEDIGVAWVVVFEGAAQSGSLPLVEVDGGGLRSTNYSATVYANASTLVVSETPTLDSRLKRTAVLGVPGMASATATGGSAMSVGVDALDGPFDSSTDDDVTAMARWDATGGSDGSGAYVAALGGLVSGEAYHVRVSAFNGFGHTYGAATYATPTPKFGLEKYGVR